jgi:GNAT superfamily N-acetyltransferase
VHLRPARAEEAAALRALTVASKGSWGYEPERLRAWGESLDIVTALKQEGEAVVAEIPSGLAGWAQVLAPAHGVSVLEHLWVAPSSQRVGIGSALFRHAAAAARRMGATTMEWEAEPNAAGFYARMGGHPVRTTTSEWGRILEVMAVDLRP